MDFLKGLDAGTATIIGAAITAQQRLLPSWFQWLLSSPKKTELSPAKKTTAHFERIKEQNILRAGCVKHPPSVNLNGMRMVMLHLMVTT